MMEISKKKHTTVTTEKVIIGKIGAPYGICGWLRVFSYTAKTLSIFNYQPWFIKKIGKWKPIRLENWKNNNQKLLIKIKDIENRTSATLLTNNEIIIDSAQLPKPEKGIYYWNDLIKCQVITTSGYQLGKVINLIETVSNDVLVVKANPNDKFNIKERLIPFLDWQVIKNVNLKTNIIEVNWDPNF